MAFLEHLSSSSYQGILTQYFDATGRISSKVTVTSYTDPVSSPTEVEGIKIAKEAEAAIAAKGWSQGHDDQFLVLPAPGTKYTISKATFCAYHEQIGQSALLFVPYMGDKPFDACLIVDPGKNITRATTFGVSHEYAESATNPHPGPGGSPWVTEDANHFEIADICAFKDVEIGGGSWVTGLWDNFMNECGVVDATPAKVYATASEAAGLSPNEALLKASIYPEGLQTEASFEYGTTASYGSTTEGMGVKAKSAIDATQAVSQRIGNLKPEETYHFRVVASNSTGTFHGPDRIFTTSRWSIQPPALPAGEYHNMELKSVSCTATNACTAVGTYRVTLSGNPVTLAERWNGSEWMIQSTPNPEGANESILSHVSCRSASSCVAVGKYKTSGYAKPLAERWDGTSWSIQSVPMPTPTGAEVALNGVLSGISCSSTSSCVAVGQYVNTQEGKIKEPTEEKTLIESWNGTAWTVQASPNREGKKGNQLTAVSCSSSAACTAVGSSVASVQFVSAPSTLVERWSGSSWSIQSSPNVSGANRSQLEDVACSSSTSCIAVGDAEESHGFTMSWDGSTWQVLSSGLATPLYAVSCLSAVSCDAVGANYSPAQGLHWNGMEWLPEKMAEETGWSSVQVRGISCPVQGRCRAVGSRAGNQGVPVIERLTPAVGLVSFFTVGKEIEEVRVGPVAVDAEGNLWISAELEVVKYNPKGELLAHFGSFGPGNGEFRAAAGIAISAAGNLWVVDRGANRVQEFNAKGEYLAKFGSSGSGNGQFNSPEFIAIDAGGNLWVSDWGNHRVQEFNSKGEYIRSVKGGSGNGPELQAPGGLAFDGEGHLWVADQTANHVVEYSSIGTYIGQFGVAGSGSGSGQLEQPRALAIRSSGDLLVGNGTIGTLDSRVEEFTPSGEYVTEFGGAQLDAPQGIGLAPGGVIWVPGNPFPNRIEKWIPLSAPSVSGVGASSIAPTEEKVSATINPTGLQTTYRIEYGTTTAYGANAPVPNAAVGSGLAGVEISQTLSGLVSTTTYHFRIAAGNAEGTTYSNDSTFTTG